MILNQLTHWRTSGTPDVFRETWAEHEWGVISHGQPHDAGFVQRVEFERPVKKVTLSVVASLYTDGRLMLRLGINPQGDTNPAGVGVQWSAWLGAPWWMGEPRTLAHTVDGLSTNAVTVFLRGATGGWTVRANVSRWRDARLEVEYAEPEPEPEIPRIPPIYPRMTHASGRSRGYRRYRPRWLAWLRGGWSCWNRSASWPSSWVSQKKRESGGKRGLTSSI
jgi:hypothetical protein